jgi:hypothetical protein
MAGLLPQVGKLTLGLILILLSGCSHKAGIPKAVSPVGPIEISSTDGQCRLTVPPGWAADPELNASAELQVSNRKEELYSVVLTEARADFDEMSLEKYSRITRRALMKTLKSPRPAGPKKLTIDGSPAVQYEINGVMDGINVVYLHTIVEGKKNYFQLLAWTMKSKFEAEHPTLDKIVNSFHALDPAPSKPGA